MSNRRAVCACSADGILCGKAGPRYAGPLSGFRHMNLSGDDYSNQLALLLNATFGTRTKWPPAKKLPKGFDPAEILAIGKDPGLGIRSLHEHGITGRGVTIAIIDQPLLKIMLNIKINSFSTRKSILLIHVLKCMVRRFHPSPWERPLALHRMPGSTTLPRMRLIKAPLIHQM